MNSSAPCANFLIVPPYLFHSTNKKAFGLVLCQTEDIVVLKFRYDYVSPQLIRENTAAVNEMRPRLLAALRCYGCKRTDVDPVVAGLPVDITFDLHLLAFEVRRLDS